MIPTMLNPLDVAPTTIGTIQLALSSVLPVLFLIGVLSEHEDRTEERKSG
jgi:hypothetical protein